MNEHSRLPFWKRSLLSVYFHATLPYRWMWLAAQKRRSAAPLMIVFYHRVADEHPNPWTIDRNRFEQHLNWMQSRFDMITLEEMQRRMRQGDSPRPALSMTFDDGYAENCEFALPLLIKRRIPCTYFVTARHVLAQTPFAHDAAIRQPGRPNTIEQLRALAAAGVEIGCHTRTHPDLGAVRDEERLEDEIVTARDDLQRAIDARLRYFAFPFGLHANLNPAAFRIARRAGFEAVCSAYGGFNFPGDDAFHLQRIHGDPEPLLLKNYLTVDPRKLHRVVRYQCSEANAPAARERATAFGGRMDPAG